MISPAEQARRGAGGLGPEGRCPVFLRSCWFYDVFFGFLRGGRLCFTSVSLLDVVTCFFFFGALGLKEYAVVSVNNVSCFCSLHGEKRIPCFIGWVLLMVSVHNYLKF